MSDKSFITAEYVRSIFYYDKQLGVLIWKERYDVPKEWNTRYANKIAGTNSKSNRWQILINNKKYIRYHLIWVYHHGYWSIKAIDHIDGNSMNDKIENLREATDSQNAGNSKIPYTNTTGLKGVCKYRSKWRAQIRVNGPKVWLGDFNCPAAASFAYQIASDIHFGEFARQF